MAFNTKTWLLTKNINTDQPLKKLDYKIFGKKKVFFKLQPFNL